MRELMRTDEVSEETGIPAATLRYWRHIGAGPRSAKLGRRVVYRRSDVEAWVEAQFDAERKVTA
ncbi:helix-turn-helix transcriptional regulator [Isoptericola sp. NPDC056618]|uniref:helix-turn-helix transcriptional regulator n=1 Tax=Isoptericola sp. NPDC056618 TaxID=3345878 RepID=UPI0036CCAC9D